MAYVAHHLKGDYPQGDKVISLGSFLSENNHVTVVCVSHSTNRMQTTTTTATKIMMMMIILTITIIIITT